MKTYFGVVLLMAMLMFAGLSGFAEKAQKAQAEAHKARILNVDYGR